MTRMRYEQLELDFENDCKPSDPGSTEPRTQLSASVVCFSTHLRLRNARVEDAKDARLLELITSRVKHFK